MTSCKRTLTAIVLLIASLLIFSPLYSQNRKMDSLRSVFSSSNDTSKVLILCQFSRFYTSNNPDTGEVLSGRALELAKKINYPFGMASAYGTLGYALNTKSKYDEAIQNLQKGLDIFEKIGYKKGISNTCNTMANTYLGTNNKNKAKEYYLKCYEVANKEPVNEHMVAVGCFGLGNILIEEHKYKEAITYFERSAAAFKRENNPDYEAMTINMIGEAYYNDGNYAEAEKYFLKAKPVFEANHDEYTMALNLCNLGNVEKQKKNYTAARVYYEKAMEINYKRNGWDNIQSTAKHISELSELQKDPAEALKYYKVHMQFKDSVVNTERNKAIAEAESKYESEKKEAQLVLKNLELEKSQSEVKQRNTLIYAFIGAFILFTILLFLVYSQYRQKKRTNFLLQRQFSEIKIKTSQIEEQKNIIEEKNKDIMDSINYSKHIQQAILPSENLIQRTLPNSFFIYKPKDIISGDFYFIESTHDRIYFAVVDCTGHGVPGALLSVFSQNTLKKIINTKKGLPHEILTEVCREFKTNLTSHGNESLSINDGMDIALACLDKNENKLYFSGAKNPLLLVRSNEMLELKADRWSISGRNEDQQLKFTNHELELKKGDKIYMFSDGIVDQFGGPKGKKFKYKQIKELIQEASKMMLSDQKKFIETSFLNWKGPLEQLDDVTLICVSL